MNCADARLDEYLDGELAGPDRAATEGHLASCASCRQELERSRKLEAVLRSVSIGASPDPDRFLESVRVRSRRSRGGWWAAAAAVLVAGTGLAAFLAPSGPVDVPGDLERYSRIPSADVEQRIRRAGPAGLAQLERALDDPRVKVQFAAATLLFKLADDATRARVLARFQTGREPGAPWTLSEPGTDDTDAELVPITVSLAVDGQDPGALDLLRKLNRLNGAARRKVVDSVVTLLHSTNVDIQRHALEIVKKLEIEFPLAAVVDLVDSPELGEEAARFLRRETGQDWGRNKERWLRAVGGKK